MNPFVLARCRGMLCIIAVCIFVCFSVPMLAQESIVESGAEVEVLADGFSFTEGPAADSKGNVYFTDQPNDRILIWSVDGNLSTFRQPAGRSNGLSFETGGNLWACADEKGELWNISPEGDISVILDGYNGKRFNGPNDIWIAPGGGIYFTDPFYPRDYWKHTSMTQDAQCVYYLAPGKKNPIRVADDLRQPNGIIGTPDGKMIYIADIGARKTYRYDIRSDGTLSGRELFCEMGSDGMTIDNEGNVYLTGMGVTVYNPKGERIHTISVQASWTANVCFGGKDLRTLFITASDKLLGLKMRVQGVGSE